MSNFTKDLNYYQYRAKNLRRAIKDNRVSLSTIINERSIVAHKSYIKDLLKDLKEINKKIKGLTK